jgi:hypothetical protein
MTKEEQLDKVCKDFSSLCEEQQDYILGILQALAFAKRVTLNELEPCRDRDVETQ